MRWSVKLSSPRVVIENAAADPSMAGGDNHPLMLGPDAESRLARVEFVVDSGVLSVSASAEGLPEPGARPDHPDWYDRAHLCVMIDPDHDHATRWRWSVDDRGQVTSECHFAIPGEELNDDAAREMDPPPAAVGEFAYTDRHRFTANLRIPTDRLWSGQGGVSGLAIGVGFHEGRIPKSLVWPEPVSWTEESPLVYGDFYRGRPALSVSELEITEPTWGPPACAMTLRGTLSPGAPRSGVVGIRFELPGDGEYDQESVRWDCTGEAVEIPIPIVFPFRAKWANGLQNIARLHLKIAGDDGDDLWSAAYPIGFDGGIIVRERYGLQEGSFHPRPQPDDGQFLDQFRSYVLTRIPDYAPRTTSAGAPSDFYLEDRAGEADLDLSAPDALDRVADLLVERFETWQDALCGAAMWVHHPSITRHSSTWSRVSNGASLETIPRLAGCFCGDTARLTALLAEKIGERAAVDLEGLSMGLRGHLGTLVATPIGEVVIDGMLGLWFHTLDNTRLATLEEMRASREIAERVWYSPRAHDHEFFYGVDNQLIKKYRSGPLIWPPGA